MVLELHIQFREDAMPEYVLRFDAVSGFHLRIAQPT